MSSLDIDFAADSRRGPSPAGLALLLAGAIVLALVSLEMEDIDQQTAAAESRLRSLTRRGAAPASDKAAGAAIIAAAPASEALARLRTPWPDLLEQLEALSDQPVVVLELGAEARGRTLRLAGEAKSLSDMFAFVEGLRQSRRFDEVFLQGHETRKLGAVEVIAFTVQAVWPASLDSTREATP